MVAAKLLLELGADPNRSDSRGVTALHLACSPPSSIEMLELLLQKGAEVDAMTDYGYTPLITCCSSGNSEFAQFLVSRGADVNHGSESGVSPLAMALLRTETDLADMLIEQGAELTDQAVLFVISHRNGAIPKASDIELLNKFDRIDFSTPNGKTVWRTAVKSSIVGYAELLLDKGADPSFVDNTGRPMILLAMEGRYFPQDIGKMFPDSKDNRTRDMDFEERLAWEESLKEKMVLALLEAGADPDATGRMNETLLHIAAGRGKLELMKALIAADADVNAVNRNGDTPLFAAVRSKGLDAVKLLLENGADPEHKNRRGRKAIECTKDERISELIKRESK
jgi:ankyrin repeat protein